MARQFKVERRVFRERADQGSNPCRVHILSACAICGARNTHWRPNPISNPGAAWLRAIQAAKARRGPSPCMRPCCAPPEPPDVLQTRHTDRETMHSMPPMPEPSPTSRPDHTTGRAEPPSDCTVQTRTRAFDHAALAHICNNTLPVQTCYMQSCRIRGMVDRYSYRFPDSGWWAKRSARRKVPDYRIELRPDDAHEYGTDVESTVRRIVERVVERFRPVAVWLFGSIAR